MNGRRAIGRDFLKLNVAPARLCDFSDKTVHLEPSLIYGTSLRMMLRGCWIATPQPPPSFFHPDQFDKMLQKNSTSAEEPSMKPETKSCACTSALQLELIIMTLQT